MRIIYLFIFIALLIAGCKPSDLKISTPIAAFSRASFNHDKFLSASCKQCHENKRPISNPAHGNGADCISCHTAATNMVGVRSWLNLTNFNHSPMPSSCISCHENKRPLTISPHQKGEWGEKQDCVSCHTHPSWKPAKFDHIKPLTDCVQCHRTANKDDRPLPKTSHPSASYNQLDCILCHTNSNNSKKWADLIFNHRTHTPAPTGCMNCHETMRPLSHTVTPKISGMDKADCNSCHTSTIDWKQVSAFDHDVMKPTSCMGCHSRSIPANQTAHPSVVGNYSKIDCVQCHTYDKSTSPRSWTKITFNYNTHSPTPTSCLTCHKTINNSLPASGTHLAGSRSTLDCATCHKYDGIKLWTNFSVFNHIAIDATERCDSCHNSSIKTLTSKPATHISTTLDCRSCHSSTAWKPASFSHSASDTNCMSCHNGTTAPGKPVTHVRTIAQCNTCHTQTAWKPATYLHTTSDTDCLTCHNGTTAMGRPAGHNLPTANHQCGSCHNQTSFSTLVFDTTYKHSSAGGLLPKGTSYHKSQSTCTKCHSTTTDNVNYTDTAANATLSPKCAGCHTSDYSGRHGSTPISTNANCLRCHSYNGW